MVQQVEEDGDYVWRVIIQLLRWVAVNTWPYICALLVLSGDSNGLRLQNKLPLVHRLLR